VGRIFTIFHAHGRTGLTEWLCVCYVMRHSLVSLVDGFNLPMAIIPSASNCSVASCPVDLNPGCPQQLVGPLDPSGNPVGCKSACVANLDNPGACLSPTTPPLRFVPLFVRPFPVPTLPHTSNINLTCGFLARNTADSANCCTGSHNTANTCPTSGVQYYSYFSAYFLLALPLSPFL